LLNFAFRWSTYPVSSTAPAPYNDSTAWGIVPAWGYASVVESTTAIVPGTVIWGFWPTSSGYTDLKIQPSSSEGQWTEVSKHRSQLMTIYNQYSVVPNFPDISSLSENELQQTAWEILFRPTWGSGHLISQHVFTPSPETQPPIHPLGIDASWTASDADLSSAVIVSLSASGKTARSCGWHLSQRPKASGPLGILQITSNPNIGTEGRIATRTIAYGDVFRAGTLEWIARFEPSRIVVLDFGGRGNSLDNLLDSLERNSALTSLKVTIVKIGNEQKVIS
jgi:hypothetical protein